MLKMSKWILVVISVINSSCALRNQSTVDHLSQNDTTTVHQHHNLGTGAPVQLPWFLKVAPFFDLTKIPQINAVCRRDFQAFLDAMDRLELWALKMHDATAKIPSGIFNGNLNQYGDFDMCLNIVAGTEEFQGKYCIAYVQPRSRNGTFKDLLKLIQSHEFFKSTFSDCGHRTPRFSHINWAVCLPSSCSATDLELAIQTYLDEFSEDSDILIEVKVDEEMCQMKKETTIDALDRNTKRVILLLVAVVVLCAASTIYDLKKPTEKNQWLVTFSLSKNIQDLLNTDDNANDIRAVHGIRMFNALVLMATHKSMSTLFLPFINRTQMTERLANPFLLVYASAASLYTDVFLMLSGLLTVYSFYGRLSKGRRIVIWREILDRYVRIIPSVVFLILFCTFILPLLGSGPLWNLVVTSHANICRQNYWRNLLFLQNWFGYNSICLTNTHHVGIDMQLFVLATFLTPILYKYPKRGLQLVIGFALLSTFARFYVTVLHELSIHIFFGISLAKIAEVADRMYIIPPFRFTVYAMGMLVGFVLRKYKDHRPTPNQVRLGWTLGALSFIVTSIASVRMNFPDYEYDKYEAGVYAALAPAGWCVFSAWIIYIAEKGSTNQIVQLFSMKFQKIFTKLAFAIYLTQFPIFFYNVGKVRNAEYFEFFKIMYNVEEFTTIFACSLTLHLLIEAPFNNIRKLIFDKKMVAAKKID